MQKDINHKSNPSSSSSICIKNNQPKVSLFSSEFFTGILSVEYSPRRSFGVPSTSALRHTWIKVLLSMSHLLDTIHYLKGKHRMQRVRASMHLSKTRRISKQGFSTNLSHALAVVLDGSRFLCPLMWYYATFLYFGNHYRKDPRERAGLAASAIAAMACSVLLLVIIIVSLLF
ncbi:hypothetical protein V6N13_107328 [Hibiscus sabdariffa]